MISNLDLESKCQGQGKTIKIINLGNKKHTTCKKVLAGIPLVPDVQPICQQVMNDLLMIIKVGQQRSRMIRLNIITARRFLASKNQFQIAMLEFGYLGHQTGTFSPAQHTHM